MLYIDVEVHGAVIGLSEPVRPQDPGLLPRSGSIGLPAGCGCGGGVCLVSAPARFPPEDGSYIADLANGWPRRVVDGVPDRRTLLRCPSRSTMEASRQAKTRAGREVRGRSLWGGATCELLAERFGRDRVRLDNQSMAPGAGYPAMLRSAPESMRVLLVLIGPEWLSADPASSQPWVQVAEVRHRHLGIDVDWLADQLAELLPDDGRSGTSRPVPRQLPAGSGRFVGRRKQLARLDALLGNADPRLESSTVARTAPRR